MRRGESPGTYKKHDYIVGQDEVGASAEDTPYEMAELIDDMHSTDINSSNVIKAAAYFHCKMENIHPFSDGNGRTGRLLVNHLLINHNNPPMIIFNEDKKEYFNALRSWDAQQSISEMTEFIKQEIVKTWSKQVLKTLAIPRKAVNSKEKLIFSNSYNNFLYSSQNEEIATIKACKEFIQKGYDSADTMRVMYDLLPKANEDDMYPIHIINKVNEDSMIVNMLHNRENVKKSGGVKQLPSIKSCKV